MKSRATRRSGSSPDPKHAADAVERELRRAFTPAVIDELRQSTGYNPRQRLATAYRLVLTVVEAFLVGQTLSFASLRAIFVRRFGFVRSCPFQKRFKQASAAAFFRAALERLVASVVEAAGLELRGPLAKFADVRVYDGTGQRVPARGRHQLPACRKGAAGAKWVVGYSIKTGLLEHGNCGAETASETPLWKLLVPSFTRGALYLFDLGFFERQLFADAQNAGAHVLMRLKKTAKVCVIGHFTDGSFAAIPRWSLGYYLGCVSRRRGTLFDLDVLWGRGKDRIALRLVGVAHTSQNIRWYLTTVPRYALSARQVVQAYRLRWLVELLFRELKQNTDIGRSFTADPNAIEALTYGAMLAHVVVRSLRIHAALANEIPLEQLRPLACLHVARAYARDVVDALAGATRPTWVRVVNLVANALTAIARELKPSRSRQRIALKLGAIGA
jgi:hypothetical protein